ncbi:MAG: glycoside hydrolase family 15 protein, partial [Actinobacteria bacterium]|nr:glycoside hydrolase family 15 protein [Actinomycetota bacterium]
MNGIGDYALIGDCHSAALVGPDGSIDWACFPRFDSPSVFGRILDEKRGGGFQISPKEVRSVKRAYMRDTNVIVTTFECARGLLELTDCMPLARSLESRGPRVRASHSILRRARCTEGVVELEVTCAPRFEYGSFVPRFDQTSPTTAMIVGGADAIEVVATHPIAVTDDEVRAHWRLHEDEDAWIEAAWSTSYEPNEWAAPRGSIADAPRRLAATVAFWRDWMRWCWYDGDHSPLVRRSALTLKAMTYSPSGAVVAAPTTSLPEEIGGERNWDYRYTWIRDATLTLTSLFVLGFAEEADAFKGWLERATAGRPADLQVMYGVGGERWLPEHELPHLSGHRGSSPVRIGNGAVGQTQLDIYGQILESAYLFGKAGGAFTKENWAFLSSLADAACERWRLPDQGIWEIRDAPRHFTHSKLNCWMALDRALKLARARALPGDLDRWARERDAIRFYLLKDAAPDGCFHQAVGFPYADAATLLIPAVGFMPTSDP